MFPATPEKISAAALAWLTSKPSMVDKHLAQSKVASAVLPQWQQDHLETPDSDGTALQDTV